MLYKKTKDTTFFTIDNIALYNRQKFAGVSNCRHLIFSKDLVTMSRWTSTIFKCSSLQSYLILI